jgi:hypothetical protein
MKAATGRSSKIGTSGDRVIGQLESSFPDFPGAKIRPKAKSQWLFDQELAARSQRLVEQQKLF